MTVTANQTRLRSQLASMIALEAAIEHRLEELMPVVTDHTIASTLIADFRALSRDHRLALETRLSTLGGNELPTGATATMYAAGIAPDTAEYPVSSSLQEIYTLYNQALIGYAMLGSLSSRQLDSLYVADEGTSFHLARQNMDDYVGAVLEISRLINDVVLWELDRDGAECQCQCPACGAGICLCSAFWRNVLSDAWQKAGPIANDVGIYVQHPKRRSAAIQAGLVRGDIILAVEGDKIQSLEDIQSAVRNSQPGEVVQLTVRRHSDGLEEVALGHP